LGAGVRLGGGPGTCDRLGRSGVDLPGLRRPPPGYAHDRLGTGALWPLPRDDRARSGTSGLRGRCRGRADRAGRGAGGQPVGAGGLLMLGKFTFLLDGMHRVPILGGSRIPVRYHLWVSLAVAAMAAVGVDRLSRPGRVRLGGAVATLAAMALASVPILVYVYGP